MMSATRTPPKIWPMFVRANAMIEKPSVETAANDPKAGAFGATRVPRLPCGRRDAKGDAPPQFPATPHAPTQFSASHALTKTGAHPRNPTLIEPQAQRAGEGGPPPSSENADGGG